MTAPPAFELLDRRVLGCLVFTDPLGRMVRTPVAVRPVAEGVRLMAKRPGEVVILEAPGLAAHISGFDAPPAAPAPGSVAVVLDVKPADGALAPRRVAVGLPRDPDPAHGGSPDSLFQPIVVPLLAAPASSLSGLAAALRVTVRRADDSRAIEGALVRLRPEGGRPEILALTDAAGEALLLAPGVPLSSPGPGAVVVPDIGGAIDAIVDAAQARFHTQAEIQVARQGAAGRTGGFIDPDDVIARLAAQATPAAAVRIAAGRTRFATIAWTAP